MLLRLSVVFIAGWYSFVWIYQTLLTKLCSPIDGYLDFFQFLAFMNKGTLHICMQVLCGHMFSFFGINS